MPSPVTPTKWMETCSRCSTALAMPSVIGIAHGDPGSGSPARLLRPSVAVGRDPRHLRRGGRGGGGVLLDPLVAAPPPEGGRRDADRPDGGSRDAARAPRP